MICGFQVLGNNVIIQSRTSLIVKLTQASRVQAAGMGFISAHFRWELLNQESPKTSQGQQREISTIRQQFIGFVLDGYARADKS